MRVERNGNLFDPGTLNLQLSTDPAPSSRLHRPLAQAIGHGKSYPVTAAQLLPITHGISRADPLIKLAKNCREK